MQQVQQASRRLADETGDRLVHLFGLVETGELTTARFHRLGAASVALANVRGVALADLGLTAEFMRQTGRATRPLGVRPTDVQVDQTRIALDIERIFDNPPASADTPEQLAGSRASQLHRLGRSETLLTVAATVQLGMMRREARGWVRQLAGPDNCPTCVAWADGVTRSPDTRMARHPGCDCIQQPQF